MPGEPEPTQSEQATNVRHLFVDEAGDGTLYDRHGKCLVGTEGCSRYLMLGAIEVADPVRLTRELNELHSTLLADPYFAGVPSMQPEARKTTLGFHAKDDVPEVRREVLRLLGRHEIRFYAVVRDKRQIERAVQQRNKTQAGYRYHPNELYDYMTLALFFLFYEEGSACRVTLSSRGSSDRTRALREAIRRHLAAQNRAAEFGDLQTAAARTVPNLQAADYFLWSLQRLFENREERYVKLLWPQYHNIMYMRGGTRRTEFTQEVPLTLTSLAEAEGVEEPEI
jgi:hypothetical protein